MKIGLIIFSESVGSVWYFIFYDINQLQNPKQFGNMQLSS